MDKNLETKMEIEKQAKPAFSSWSGGKDSCLALHYAERAGYHVPILLNMLTRDGAYSRSHGLRPEMIEIQARAMGKRIVFGRADWEDYEQVFLERLSLLKKEGTDSGIFGDIDLREHRDWVERVCKEAGMNAALPLWGRGREELLEDFISAGFRAVIVCVKEAALGLEWLGRELDHRAIEGFRDCGIDLCGEEGEYHSFVFDGPSFTRPVQIKTGHIQRIEGYAFVELEP
jgi:uncharacterized protein (TIGR00290 family)